MTAAARMVLRDCVLAHQLLEEGTSNEVWRVHWVGALSLLRAVGNVLKNSDGADPACRRISDQMFQEWQDKHNPVPHIFRDFIKVERDSILKEYTTAANLENEVHILVEPTLEPHVLCENIFRPLESGPWAGEDARDVYEMAIDWWKNQLDVIDRLVLSDKPIGSG